MAKLSELDLIDAKSFLRVEFDLDDYFIELALDCAKSYVCSYTKRTMEELDEIPEVCMAVLVLVGHFYDHRSLETDSDVINYTIDKILGTHWFYMSDSQMSKLEGE